MARRALGSGEAEIPSRCFWRAGGWRGRGVARGGHPVLRGHLPRLRGAAAREPAATTRRAALAAGVAVSQDHERQLPACRWGLSGTGGLCCAVPWVRGAELRTGSGQTHGAFWVSVCCFRALHALQASPRKLAELCWRWTWPKRPFGGWHGWEGVGWGVQQWRQSGSWLEPPQMLVATGQGVPCCRSCWPLPTRAPLGQGCAGRGRAEPWVCVAVVVGRGEGWIWQGPSMQAGNSCFHPSPGLLPSAVRRPCRSWWGPWLLAGEGMRGNEPVNRSCSPSAFPQPWLGRSSPQPWRLW